MSELPQQNSSGTSLKGEITEMTVWDCQGGRKLPGGPRGGTQGTQGTQGTCDTRDMGGTAGGVQGTASAGRSSRHHVCCGI